jgi:hypothetical protein
VVALESAEIVLFLPIVLKNIAPHAKPIIRVIPIVEANRICFLIWAGCCLIFWIKFIILAVRREDDNFPFFSFKIFPLDCELVENF